MQTHTMKLTEAPFDAIAAGAKQHELRLNDEKRQKVQVGDQIEFRKLPDLKDHILVTVTSLTPYNDFEEMFEDLNQAYPKWKKDDWLKGMYQYYSPEDERMHGVLAIGIQLSS